MLLRTRSTSSRRGWSRRRSALLIALAALLATMWILRALDIAGFNGTAPGQMDWNGDGQVSWPEIIQGFYAVRVDETREGARTCRRYAFLRAPDVSIRVDCRVEFTTP